MSFSKLQEINTTTYEDYILISQNSEKQNQESFVFTFAKTPLPGTKKRSGSSELQVAVPSQENRKMEKYQKLDNVWLKQYFRELYLRPPFVLAFITQAPFKYLYNPQNHYTMAETRKSKDDKRKTTLKKNLKEKISSCGINLESQRMITNGKPEMSNGEKTPSKLSHTNELFMKTNATSETNLEFHNSKITMEMYSRNDKEKSINSKKANNEATFWKDNPNTNSKKSSEEFSDDTSECISSPNIDLVLFLNEFRAKSADLKRRIKTKISSYAINLESMKMKTDGKPEKSNREKLLSKLSHKCELFKQSNVTSKTNLGSKYSKITVKMYLRNDEKNVLNSKMTNTLWKDNPNTNSKKSSEEFSADTSECISSSNTDLKLFLNEFRSESSDLDEWLTNYSHNNAKKPSKKVVKKDADPDSGDSKDAKKEGKKKEKKDVKKKKDLESTDAESGDSKNTKKDPKKDKKEKKEVKKKKEPESTGAESGDTKELKKSKKEKNENKKNAESSDAGSVDSKGGNKEKKRPKKDANKDAVYTDTESDVESKKKKKNEKKEGKENKRKPTKDTESTDADSESEADPKAKKGEKKDKKASKKGEKKDAKKNIESSDSEIEVKKKKKEAMKDSGKNVVSNTDSASDASSKSGVRKGLRPSETESEESSGFKVIKTTDDSDATSPDMKKGTSQLRRGFRTSYKKTTFGEKGGKGVAGRIPSSRERLPFPPCEPFQASPKPRRVCKCMKPPPPPKPRCAPLPGVEWIHKLL